MNAPAEPDWNCLPHDPVGFFNLPEDFDRTALKRSYNALIKRFKPEKSPVEFQRIRTAFEQLDSRWDDTLMPFRGPLVPRPRVETPPDEDDSADASHADATDADGSHDEPGFRPRPGRVVPLSLAERIAAQPPRDLQTELDRQLDKSPEDYLLLAIVNDALGDGSAEPFFATLLAGLSIYHDSAILCDALDTYLQTVPSEQADRHLQRLFEVRPLDTSFGLSTPLWFALAKGVPFEAFRQRYEACERIVRSPRRLARFFLILRLWPKIAYDADPDWWNAKLRELDSVSDQQLPPWCEQQLWELQQLGQHLQGRRAFLNGDPLRDRMDAALRAFFQDDPRWVEQFLDLNRAMAGDYELVRRAFLEIGAVLPEEFQSVWLRVAMESAVHDGRDLRQPPAQSVLRAARSLPDQLRRLALGFPWNPRLWTRAEAITLAVLYVVFPLTIFIGTLAVEGAGPTGTVLATLFMFFVGAPVAVILTLLAARVSVGAKSPSVRRSYELIVPILVEFVRKRPLQSHELLEELMRTVRHDERLATVLGTLNFDRAFWFYALATRLTGT